MPSFPSIATLFRFIPQHEEFRFFISILFAIVGVLLQYSSLFEASSAMVWSLTIFIIYVITTLVTMPSFSFRSITDLLRSIPRHEGFGYLIQDLTFIVQRHFPNSSPLEGNSIRTWIFMASRSIYRYNGDVISGSLTSAILISFLISCDETPIYVFLIWAIWVISYLKNNLAAIPSN